MRNKREAQEKLKHLWVLQEGRKNKTEERKTKGNYTNWKITHNKRKLFVETFFSCLRTGS